MTMLTSEVRKILIDNPEITGPQLAERLSNGHVQLSRHQGKRLLQAWKLEQAIAKGETKPAPSNNYHAETREEWFMRAVAAIEATVAKAGYKLPKVRIGCGFPQGGKRSNSLGECWGSKHSIAGDEVFNIFINPRLNTAQHDGTWMRAGHDRQHQGGDVTVLGTVWHEYAHAVLFTEDYEHHNKHPHGKEFKALIHEMGMEMIHKKGSTIFTDEGLKLAHKVLEEIGPYPMAPLDTGVTSAKKKQTTRMVRCFDPQDEKYSVRCTREVLAKGTPVTPDGRRMLVDLVSLLKTYYIDDKLIAEGLVERGDKNTLEITDKGEEFAKMKLANIADDAGDSKEDEEQREAA